MLLPLLAIGLLSCNSARDSLATTAASTSPASAAPSGVEPGLWQQLTMELERVLAESGRDRTTSAAPVGPGSVIGNFNAYLSGVDQRVYFGYRNQGDYDVNGLVTISDLTPVGIHFGKSVDSADWSAAQLADGDANGVITIADVTPIGQNFGGGIDGYELQVDPGGGFVMHAEFEFSELQSADSAIPYVSAVTDMEGPGRARVVPFDTQGAERLYGPPSNIDQIPIPLTLEISYPQFRANSHHTGQAIAEAPPGTQELWSLPLPGENVSPSVLAADENGTVYFGTGIYSQPGDQGLEGYMYAVDIVGNLLWRKRLSGAVTTTPVLTERGDLILPVWDGTVYSISRDGYINWTYETELRFYSDCHTLLLDDLGVVLTGTNPEGTLSTVVALNTDGELQWQTALEFAAGSTPTLADDAAGLLTFISNSGEFVYVDTAGQVSDGPVLNPLNLPYTVVNTGNRIIVPSFFDRIHSLQPPDAGHIWYDCGEDLPSAVCYDRNNLKPVIFANIDSNNSIGRLTAISASAVFMWTMDIETPVSGDIILDRNGDIIVPVHSFDGSTSSAVYCIGQDQVVIWVHDTDGWRPSSPILVADGKVAVLYSSTDPIPEYKVVGIGI
jgi:hypothetical protein